MSIGGPHEVLPPHGGGGDSGAWRPSFPTDRWYRCARVSSNDDTSWCNQEFKVVRRAIVVDHVVVQDRHRRESEFAEGPDRRELIHRHLRHHTGHAEVDGDAERLRCEVVAEMVPAHRLGDHDTQLGDVAHPARRVAGHRTEPDDAAVVDGEDDARRADQDAVDPVVEALDLRDVDRQEEQVVRRKRRRESKHLVRVVRRHVAETDLAVADRHGPKRARAARVPHPTSRPIHRHPPHDWDGLDPSEPRPG